MIFAHLQFRNIFVAGDIQCWRECWDCGELLMLKLKTSRFSFGWIFPVVLPFNNSNPQQVGLSSDPGQGVIIAARDYERQFSAHLVTLAPPWL